MTPTDGFLPPTSSERTSADRRERLRVLLHTLAERRWLILATAAIIVAFATLRSAAQEDEYEAVSHVLVGQTDPINGLFPGARPTISDCAPSGAIWVTPPRQSAA